jgi:hypothetical protein
MEGLRALEFCGFFSFLFARDGFGWEWQGRMGDTGFWVLGGVKCESLFGLGDGDG